MEGITVTGIVLFAMPYKEKDRLIHIFSVELGKITATLRGVSLPKSKLKFGGQPFCFGKFELTGNKDFYVVKGIELIDSFYELTADYDAYTLALSCLEVSSAVLKPNILAEGLFVNLIKTLQNIVYNNINPKLAILKFHLTVLELIGYKLNCDNCDNCGLRFIGDIKFNFDTGTFRCFNCSGGEVVGKRDFMTIKMISSTDISRLHTLRVHDESLNAGLKIVFRDLCDRLNMKIKSLNFYE